MFFQVIAVVEADRAVSVAQSVAAEADTVDALDLTVDVDADQRLGGRAGLDQYLVDVEVLAESTGSPLACWVGT